MGEKIKKTDIPIFKSEENLPTEIYRERIKKNKQVFSHQFVKSYINFIIENPNEIYSEEMYIRLKILSNVSIATIFDIDEQEGLFSNKYNQKNEKGIDLKKRIIWIELKDRIKYLMNQ